MIDLWNAATAIHQGDRAPLTAALARYPAPGPSELLVPRWWAERGGDGRPEADTVSDCTCRGSFTGWREVVSVSLLTSSRGQEMTHAILCRLYPHVFDGLR